MTIKWRIADDPIRTQAERYCRDLDNANIPNWLVTAADEGAYIVYAELPNAIIVSVSDGVVQNIDNLPHDAQVIVLNYNNKHLMEHVLDISTYGMEAK